MQNADGMLQRAESPILSASTVSLFVAMSGFADTIQSVVFLGAVGQFVETGISGRNEIVERDHRESVKG